MAPAHATLLGIVAILLWSTHSAATVRLVQELGLLTSLALVCGLAGLLLAVATDLRQRRPGAFLRIGWRFGLLGGLCFALYQVLFFLAFALAGPGMAVPLNLVNYLWPSLVVVLGIVGAPAGRRIRPGLLTLGIVAGFAGILGAICPEGRWTEALLPLRQQPWAFLAMAMAAVAWAVFSVIAVPLRPVGAASGTPLFFLVVAVLAAIGRTVVGETSHPVAATWPLLAYAAVAPAAGGYLLWELAMSRGNVPLLGACGNALPLLSTLVLWAALGGQGMPAAGAGIAAALVSLGALLVHRGAGPRDASAAG